MAMIVSLLRYGQVVIGSCLPQDLFLKMETHLANVAARRVGGVDRSTRIEALHFLAGTMSYRNMYVMHCAELMDASLRAHRRTICQRLRLELREILGPSCGATEMVELGGDSQAGRMERTGQYIWDRTKWYLCKYHGKPPAWGQVVKIPGLYV